jgi:phosphoenolpyruvate carboxylase
VTPEVTAEVVTQQRLRAARLFLRDLDQLYSELAISSRFSPELIAYSDSIYAKRNFRERYRRVIRHLEKRLVKTIKICEKMLHSMDSFHSTEFHRHNNDVEDVDPIETTADLLEPLQLIYSSLVSTGFELVARGSLSDTIRRIHVFGLTLVPLDIREESTRHTEALDAVTRHLGVGSYSSWDEEARLNWLQSELSNRRPLFRTRDVHQLGFDDTVVKTLRTFHAASTLGPEAVGAYVISQAKTASDVLAVLLLQKQFGMTAENGRSMRVVPLFETLADLTNAAAVLDTLFKVPAYAGSIKGKQEVMVGYSDSAKDAGRLAALWAQYTAQESMTEVAKTHNIQLTFFHGKGGTVGRGGNPALYRAILSHPPDTINGRFRVTEQGEMITQNFGSREIAERTLDIYTAAVLREAYVGHVTPTDEWRKQMERISELSCAAYRKLVRETPHFVPYFRQATPELELATLNIGSRPAKRNPKGGIESLRAIPWTFAWTQTRMNLSAWLGVSAGLTSDDEHDAQQMKNMYNEWPWFRENIDLIAMILSKTDFSITENYDNLLVDKSIRGLGDTIREDLVRTRKAVLDVSQSTNFVGPHVQLLRASTKIRNPYVDSINCVQAELLRELRNMPPDGEEGVSDDVWEIKNVRKDALIMSVNAIAQGMKNSG